MSDAPPAIPPPEPLSPEVLALLRAIKETPDDDTPRLVLADWLEEHGDPRGALLRVQCQLGRLGDDDPRRTALRAEERRLLLRHQDSWLGPLRSLAPRREWRRGLLWLEAAARSLLRRRTPPPGFAWVEALSLYRLTPARVARLARWPGLAELVGLELRHNELDDNAATVLAASEHLAGLWRLDLANNDIGPAGATALAAAPLRRLRTLDLAYNRVGDDGVAALAASPNLSELVELRLTRNRLTDAGALVLARAPFLRRLRTLNVYGNVLGAAATAALEARFGAEVYW